MLTLKFNQKTLMRFKEFVEMTEQEKIKRPEENLHHLSAVHALDA